MSWHGLILCHACVDVLVSRTLLYYRREAEHRERTLRVRAAHAHHTSEQVPIAALSAMAILAVPYIICMWGLLALPVWGRTTSTILAAYLAYFFETIVQWMHISYADAVNMHGTTSHVLRLRVTVIATLANYELDGSAFMDWVTLLQFCLPVWLAALKSKGAAWRKSSTMMSWALDGCILLKYMCGVQIARSCALYLVYYLVQIVRLVQYLVQERRLVAILKVKFIAVQDDQPTSGDPDL